MKQFRNAPALCSAKYSPSDSATAAGSGSASQYMEPEVSMTASALPSAVNAGSDCHVALSAAFSSGLMLRMKHRPSEVKK